MSNQINQSKERFFNQLLEVFEDEREVADEQFLDQVEQLMKQYVEIFIKSQLKGKVELCPVEFTKLKKTENLGGTFGRFVSKGDYETGRTGKIIVYTERLAGLDREKRNEMIIKFFSVIAHETRHYLQWLYNVKVETGDEEGLEFLKKTLGQNADILGDHFSDYAIKNRYMNLTNMQTFLESVGLLDVMDSFKMMFTRNQDKQYLTRWVEQDARKAGRKSQQQLIDEFNGFIKRQYPAVNFPKNFKAVKSVKVDNMIAYGKSKVGKKEKQYIGKYARLTHGKSKTETKRLRDKVEERYAIEKAVKNDPEASNQKLEQTAELFEKMCKVALEEIKYEDGNISIEKQIEKMMRKMKRATLSHYIRYAEHALSLAKAVGDEIAEVKVELQVQDVFGQCERYGSDEFKNVQLLIEAREKFDEDSLLYFVFDKQIKKLAPELKYKDFFKKVSDGDVTMEQMVEFITELDNRQDLARGRLLDKALKQLMNTAPQQFASYEKLKELERAFYEKGLLWASLATGFSARAMFPDVEDNIFNI